MKRKLETSNWTICKKDMHAFYEEFIKSSDWRLIASESVLALIDTANYHDLEFFNDNLESTD